MKGWKLDPSPIYPWSKVVYFVLFCHVEISWCFKLSSWYLWKVLNELGCTNLVWNCLELPCGEAIDYWTIFSINKLETENYIGIWKHSWCCWKGLSESDLIKLFSQFSKLRYRRYWFWSGFCCWKLKQTAKIGKNQWALNVFTLGSTA